MRPPDGGWGWLVVFASFMIHAIADGVAYTFGLFYSELVVFFNSSKAVAAWVPSIMTGMTLMIGPIAAGLTTRYGCRKITILGSILAALGLALSVVAPSIYILLITIGFTAGIGFGLIYLPAIVCVTCYFEKRRAFATGLAVCGAGIGSAVFAPLINWLIMTLKWRGAMLVISLIVLSCALFGCLFRPLQFDTDEEEVVDEDDDDDIDDDDDDDAINFICESMHLADSTSEVVKVHSKTPRYSLDNSAKDGKIVHKATTKSSTIGKKTPLYGNTLKPTSKIAVSNNYLKPRPICYSASVLSLPHYKSSPALFAVDSIVVRSNSTFGCKVASHSVRILNDKSADDYSIKTDTVDMNSVSIYKDNDIGSGDKKNINNNNNNNNNLNNKNNIDSISNDMVMINSSSASSREVDTSYVKMFIKFFTDFEILKNQVFVIFAISNLATSLGFYVPHIYIKDKVKSANYINTVDVNGEIIQANVDQIITDSDAAQLIGLIGLGSTVGRLVFGYLSDQEYINRLWIYIICVSASGASVIAYAFTNSYSMLAVCSVTYGLTGGGYVSLTSVLIVDLLGLDKLTSAFGILLLFQGVASLTGPPAIGVIYDLTSSYSIGFTLAGILIVISGLMLVPVAVMNKRSLVHTNIESCDEKANQCKAKPSPSRSSTTPSPVSPPPAAVAVVSPHQPQAPPPTIVVTGD